MFWKSFRPDSSARDSASPELLQEISVASNRHLSRCAADHCTKSSGDKSSGHIWLSATLRASEDHGKPLVSETALQTSCRWSSLLACGNQNAKCENMSKKGEIECTTHPGSQLELPLKSVSDRIQTPACSYSVDCKRKQKLESHTESAAVAPLTQADNFCFSCGDPAPEPDRMSTSKTPGGSVQKNADPAKSLAASKKMQFPSEIVRRTPT